MLWNWYTIDACFLSSSWHIKNNGMFAATCIGVILLVMAVEFFRRLGKEYDAFLMRQFQRQSSRRYAAAAVAASAAAASSSTDDSRRSLDAPPLLLPQVVTFRATVLQQGIRAVLHAVTFGGAYIVMLLAMYFNGYVIICIFIGAGLGKFVCDWFEVKMTLDGGRQADRVMKGIEEPSVCCG